MALSPWLLTRVGLPRAPGRPSLSFLQRLMSRGWHALRPRLWLWARVSNCAEPGASEVCLEKQSSLECELRFLCERA